MPSYCAALPALTRGRLGVQVVERANRSCYGLAAGVFTKNLDTAHYLSRALRVGTVWINTFDNFDASIPFGEAPSAPLELLRAATKWFRVAHRALLPARCCIRTCAPGSCVSPTLRRWLQDERDRAGARRVCARELHTGERAYSDCGSSRCMLHPAPTYIVQATPA